MSGTCKLRNGKKNKKKRKEKKQKKTVRKVTKRNAKNRKQNSEKRNETKEKEKKRTKRKERNEMKSTEARRKHKWNIIQYNLSGGRQKRRVFWRPVELFCTNLDFIVSCIKTCESGAFFHYCIKNWKELPRNIKECKRKDVLKTYVNNIWWIKDFQNIFNCNMSVLIHWIMCYWY